MSYCIKRHIECLVELHGGIRSAGRVLGIDPGYLVRLRDGKKSNPSDDVLEKLGLKRVVEVSYVRGK